VFAFGDFLFNWLHNMRLALFSVQTKAVQSGRCVTRFCGNSIDSDTKENRTMVNLVRFLARQHILYALLFLTLLALLGAACMPITPPAQEEEGAEVAETATMTTTTTSPTTEGGSQPSGVLTGTVNYLQRIALPPASVIEVHLEDVSRADAPAQVLASQTITTAGENVPIPFMLTYDPAQIDPRFTYGLRVRITTGGELRWINTEHIAVLTGGAPTTGVEVIVQPVQ
jgi:uncharacterized lipoprotein YbaY